MQEQGKSITFSFRDSVFKIDGIGESVKVVIEGFESGEQVMNFSSRQFCDFMYKVITGIPSFYEPFSIPISG